MRILITALAVLLIAGSVWADLDTIGPDGINSQVTGLDGTGTIIGMLDVGRPGKPGKDLALYVNDLVNPTQVYVGNGIDGANSFWVIDDPPDMRGTHPMQVAGVMISSADGVARATSLHAGTSDTFFGDVSTNIAANRLARISGIRAINVSAGREGTPNGMSHFTQYIDWSARANNVLYVVAAADDPDKVGVPEDNYNGIGVGASQRLNGGIAGSYLQAWPENIITNLGGGRTAIDILAPGTDFLLTTQNNGSNSENGTSYAAPHVTAAVALLDQYGNFQVTLGNPRFAGEHIQHEVFKAVILNSADKMAGVHGSTRTILKQPGGMPQNWTQTQAYTSASVSLDPELGAGHLNVNSALENYKPGKYTHSGAPVPLIGWDYGTIAFGDNIYEFNNPFGGAIAITLTWDRYVESTELVNDETYVFGDTFFNVSMNDLDLYLMPKNSDDPGQAIRASTSSDNIEHIFFTGVPFGEYKIVVKNFGGGLGGTQDYAIAWWAGELSIPGDFNGDGAVNGLDFLAWQRGESTTPYSPGDLADWQTAYNGGALSAVAVPESSRLAPLLAGLAIVVSRQRVA